MFSKTKENTAEDTWTTAGGTYLDDYRESLESLAKYLSVQLWQEVVCEYNRPHKCAIFRGEDAVLARVQMYGEAGLPYKAVVRTDMDKSVHIYFATALLGNSRTVFERLNPLVSSNFIMAS